jgi:hypothetical protein
MFLKYVLLKLLSVGLRYMKHAKFVIEVLISVSIFLLQFLFYFLSSGRFKFCNFLFVFILYVNILVQKF